MSSLTVRKRYVSSSNVYVAVFQDSDGKVFDWSDSTWKVAASATTPNVNLSVICAAGTGRSVYGGSVNLSTINNSSTPYNVTLIAFKRVGGSVNLANDVAISDSESFTITSGEMSTLVSETILTALEDEIYCEVTGNFSALAGTAAHFTACLKRRNGEVVDLASFDPTATCTMEIDRDATTTGGNRASVESLNSGETGSYNSSNRFEVELTSQTFDALVGYTVTATIMTESGNYIGYLNFGG